MAVNGEIYHQNCIQDQLLPFLEEYHEDGATAKINFCHSLRNTMKRETIFNFQAWLEDIQHNPTLQTALNWGTLSIFGCPEAQNL